MKNVEMLSTPELMSFLDAITVMDEEIDRAIQVTWICYGPMEMPEEERGLTLVEKDDILETLRKEVVLIEPVRLKLVKEMTRRFQHNFGIRKGPHEIQELIKKLVIKYPNLNKSHSEIAAEREKARRIKVASSELKKA